MPNSISTDLALQPRNKNPAMPPKNRHLLDDINKRKERHPIPGLIWSATYPDCIISQDLQLLLPRLKQSSHTDGIPLSREIRPSQPRLPPNARTSEPASFLALPPELRRRILLHSSKSDWLRLLGGDMFKSGKVHPSYYKWLPECFEEWECIMRQVDHAGRLEEDVVFVVETWWKSLQDAIDEREAR